LRQSLPDTMLRDWMSLLSGLSENAKNRGYLIMNSYI
jgi:hypothetical protein